MWQYPAIDPVALALGPLEIHWYGLMYIVGFAGGFWLVVHRVEKLPAWNRDRISDLLFYIVLGVILGGRIGYMCFYNFADFAAHPWRLVMVWQGGMSFHGGLIGVIGAMYAYMRKSGMRFFQVADFVAPLVPIGLFFGRIGNFINSELWGKITDSPLGMRVYDPHLQMMVRKYPTQLLEALLEGVALFLILWAHSAKPRPVGATSGLFLFVYGSFRFFVEFFRAPDAQLGYLLWDWVTMGQLLSLPMVVIGAGLFVMTNRRHASSAAQ